MIFARRSGGVVGEPLFEEFLHPVRQPQHHPGGVRRAGLGRCRQDRRNLVVVQARDDRRDQHTDRYAGRGQRLDRRQSSRRRRRQRLHAALQLGSSVVSEIVAAPASWAASSASRSASRATSQLFVTICTGFRKSARTARQRRVISSRRSAGW